MDWNVNIRRTVRGTALPFIHDWPDVQQDNRQADGRVREGQNETKHQHKSDQIQLPFSDVCAVDLSPKSASGDQNMARVEQPDTDRDKAADRPSSEDALCQPCDSSRWTAASGKRRLSLAPVAVGRRSARGGVANPEGRGCMPGGDSLEIWKIGIWVLGPFSLIS